MFSFGIERCSVTCLAWASSDTDTGTEQISNTAKFFDKMQINFWQSDVFGVAVHGRCLSSLFTSLSLKLSCWRFLLLGLQKKFNTALLSDWQILWSRFLTRQIKQSKVTARPSCEHCSKWNLTFFLVCPYRLEKPLRKLSRAGGRNESWRRCETKILQFMFAVVASSVK